LLRLAVDSDPRAGVEKGLCYFKTDTATATRHQDTLIRKIQVIPPEFFFLLGRSSRRNHKSQIVASLEHRRQPFPRVVEHSKIDRLVCQHRCQAF
jgi:hypothetical protein